MKIQLISSSVLVLVGGYAVDASVLGRQDVAGTPCAAVSASAASQLASSPSCEFPIPYRRPKVY